MIEGVDAEAPAEHRGRLDRRHRLGVEAIEAGRDNAVDRRRHLAAGRLEVADEAEEEERVAAGSLDAAAREGVVVEVAAGEGEGVVVA
ncbi:MAG: hypothetical protein H6710_04475 [Myxococcales bacterium]|nr:hypothetical protein [Myxococcales bacterium]